MSCIKFPSTSNDSSKTSNKESIRGYLSINSELIDLANITLGEDNWSHSITNQTIDFIDVIAGEYRAGCATIVKVQLKNGNFHEGMGYSNLGGTTKGSAIQKVRVDSLNMALKQAFLCFGNRFSNKLKNFKVRTISPIPKEELLPNIVIKKERSISPVAAATNTTNIEVFSENISLSQTDALMDTVDLDQILEKVPKSNDTSNSNKDFTKTSVFKPTVSSGIHHSQNASNADSNSKKNNKEVSKPITHTAMTEEEMRLERKRKQREMQEEFKRKQESKKLHSDSGSKPPANPRY